MKLAELVIGLDINWKKSSIKTEDVSNCKHGKYYCSTDKKWKCRQGPKQKRS